MQMISSQDKTLQKISIEQELIHFTFDNSNEKYDLKIYIAKNEEFIIFKIEEIDKISFTYFYEKFDIEELNKKFKDKISTGDIKKAFNDLKNIIEQSKIRIEKENNNLNLIIFRGTENDKNKLNFILRKKYICQEKINQISIDVTNKDFKKLKQLENSSNNLNKILQNHSDIINNINNKINNINNSIQNLYKDLNQINNTFKNMPKRKEQNFEKSNKKMKNNNYREYNTLKNILNCFFIFFLNVIFLIIIFYLHNHINSINDKIKKPFTFKEKLYILLSSLEDIIEKNFSSLGFGANEKIFKDDLEYLKDDFFDIPKDSNKKNIYGNSSYEYFINFFNSDEAVNIIKELNIKTILMKENKNIINTDIENDNDEIKYFKNQISRIKNNSISNVDLKLKYSKVNSKKDFYINLKTSNDNLISFKNTNGSIIYLFCPNIIKLIENLINKNVKKGNNFDIYIFKKTESFAQNISSEEFIRNSIVNILFHINVYNKSYTSNIDDLKIYDINYYFNK